MKDVELTIGMAGRNSLQAGRRSVQWYARAAGALYLVIIVIGLLGEAWIRGGLVVSGDASATAQRILASQFLWRLGVAGELVLLVCAGALTFIWYLLLRPVNRHLAQLMVLFALMSLAVEAVGVLYLQAALTPLSSVAYLKVVDLQQLYVLAYMSIVSHSHAFGMALIFFGVECLIVGRLICKSGYFPRVIGRMMQIAGVCYLINSFGMILSPSLANLLFPAILIPAFIGESSFCLWLLIKGVDIAGWESRMLNSR
jgi:hypothetical protein